MVYLWGLHAAICILVYDTPQFASWFMWRMRSPSLWVRLLTQRGLCQRHREPVQGRRAMMKKLIIHLLFRTVNGCRLLASSLAIIWLTANFFFFFFLPGNLFKNILLCEVTQNCKELAFSGKSWVAGRWATLGPSWAVTLSKLEANGPFCGCYNSSWKYQLLYGIVTQI